MQLGILLWKCWIMRRRHYISTFFELLMPLLLGIFLTYTFSSNQPSHSQYSDDGNRLGNTMLSNHSGNMHPPTPGEKFMTVSRESIPIFENSYYYSNFTIYYAPNSPFVQNIMDRVRTYCPKCKENNRFIIPVGM